MEQRLPERGIYSEFRYDGWSLFEAFAEDQKLQIYWRHMIYPFLIINMF